MNGAYSIGVGLRYMQQYATDGDWSKAAGTYLDLVPRAVNNANIGSPNSKPALAVSIPYTKIRNVPVIAGFDTDAIEEQYYNEYQDYQKKKYEAAAQQEANTKMHVNQNAYQEANPQSQAASASKPTTTAGHTSGGGSTVIGQYSISTNKGKVTVKILSQSSYSNVRAMVSSRSSSRSSGGNK